MAEKIGQIFLLTGYGENRQQCAVITPEPVSLEIITAAWSYAVRYTAKGLDLPDHEKAIEMLKQRHPSWKVMHTQSYPVSVNLALADKDQPET